MIDYDPIDEFQTLKKTKKHIPSLLDVINWESGSFEKCDTDKKPTLYLRHMLQIFWDKNIREGIDITATYIIGYWNVAKTAEFACDMINGILQDNIYDLLPKNWEIGTKFSQIYCKLQISDVNIWKLDRETKFLLRERDITCLCDLDLFGTDQIKINKFWNDVKHTNLISDFKKIVKYKYHKLLNIDLKRKEAVTEEDSYYDRMTKSLKYFPYPEMRQEQYSLFMKLLELEEEERLLVLSPTGSGKTTVVLSSVMRHLEKGRRVIIAVRTTSQMEVYLREFYKIKNQFYILPRVGRAKLCGTEKREFHKKNSCAKCGKKIGFGLMDEVHQEMLNAEGSRLDAYIDHMSDQKICGSHLQNKFLRFSEVVLIPYRFLIKERWDKLLKRMGAVEEDVILVIDEVHNLIDLNFGVYFEWQLYRMEKLYPDVGLIKRLKEMILSDEIQASTTISKEELQEFEVALDLKIDSEALRFHQLLSDPEFYKIIIKKRELIIHPVKYYNLFHKEVYQSIFISATLYPTHLYKKIFRPDHFLINPFQRNDNIMFFTYRNLTSEVGNRNDRNFKRYADNIAEFIEISEGHVIVIFPSYDMLEGVLKFYEFDEVVRQISQVGNIKERIFNSEKLSIATVTGSQIAEGVEFVKDGKSLIKMVIFAGLPYVSTRKNYVIKNILFNHGLEYSKSEYFLKHVPVFQSIIQGAGRIARSDKDKGIVVVMDGRIQDHYWYFNQNKINIIFRRTSGSYHMNNLILKSQGKPYFSAIPI